MIPAGVGPVRVERCTTEKLETVLNARAEIEDVDYIHVGGRDWVVIFAPVQTVPQFSR